LGRRDRITDRPLDRRTQQLAGHNKRLVEHLVGHEHRGHHEHQAGGCPLRRWTFNNTLTIPRFFTSDFFIIFVLDETRLALDRKAAAENHRQGPVLAVPDFTHIAIV